MRKAEIMGVLNVTPDSFYAGSASMDHDAAVQCGLRMAQEGASWLDIGGEASSRFRNGSKHCDAVVVTEEEELGRVLPVITAIRAASPIRISIDTMKPAVASAALAAGASMINDISGFRDPDMRAVAKESGAKICVMHMRGTPQNMQQYTDYSEGIMQHLLRWADDQVNLLVKEGVREQQIILDPGLCFSKTLEDNYVILKELSKFRALGFPVLIGLSRKSMMGLHLKKPAEELLHATIALNSAAMLSGADILRVHDVEAHYDAVEVLSLLQSA